MQIQALKSSESGLYSIVCVLAALQYERVSKWLALLERCLVANYAIHEYMSYMHNFKIKLNFGIISQIPVYLIRCFKGIIHLPSRKV